MIGIIEVVFGDQDRMGRAINRERIEIPYIIYSPAGT